MKPLNEIAKRIAFLVIVVVGLVFIMALASLLASYSARADEAALYDEAPEGSAFIRLVNLTSSLIEAELGNKMLLIKGYCHASEYIYLSGGEYVVNNQNVNWSGELQPDQAYSLIVSYAGARLEQEQRFSGVRKALLAVYNFSSNTIGIRTTQGGKPIFGVIESDAQKVREVNPLKIKLSIYTGDKVALDVASVIFQPGVISSLLVCHDGVQMVAHWSDS